MSLYDPVNTSLYYISSLDSKTLHFIENRPYMTKTIIFQLSSGEGTLDEITYNHKFCQLTDIEPNDYYSFKGVNLFETSDWMQFYLSSEGKKQFTMPIHKLGAYTQKIFIEGTGQIVKPYIRFCGKSLY